MQDPGRAVRSWPGGLDPTEPQMWCPIYPQPYGSGFTVNVKEEFCEFFFRDGCSVKAGTFAGRVRAAENGNWADGNDSGL